MACLDLDRTKVSKSIMVSLVQQISLMLFLFALGVLSTTKRPSQEPTRCFKVFHECSKKINRTHGDSSQVFKSLKNAFTCTLEANATTPCTSNEGRFLEQFLLQVFNEMVDECSHCTMPFLTKQQRVEVMSGTDYPPLDDYPPIQGCRNEIMACKTMVNIRKEGPDGEKYVELYTCVDAAPSCMSVSDWDYKQELLAQIAQTIDEKNSHIADELRRNKKTTLRPQGNTSGKVHPQQAIHMLSSVIIIYQCVCIVTNCI